MGLHVWCSEFTVQLHVQCGIPVMSTVTYSETTTTETTYKKTYNTEHKYFNLDCLSLGRRDMEVNTTRLVTPWTVSPCIPIHDEAWNPTQKESTWPTSTRGPRRLCPREGEWQSCCNSPAYTSFTMTTGHKVIHWQVSVPVLYVSLCPGLKV